MSGLIPFSFDGREIRVVTDERGEPLFVGKDICAALGFADATSAMRNHCKGVLIQHPLQTAGGLQDARVLSEPDVLRLIVNCKLPAAQEFERLVFEDILPTIRRTGSYVPNGLKLPTAVDAATQALKLAPLAMRAARMFGLDKNAAAISANQYVHAVTGQNLLQGFGQTHLLAEKQETQWFTPTELGPEAQVSARKLNEALAAAGLQERRGKAWELTPAGHAYARLFDTSKRHNSGVMVQQIKWSPSVLLELRKTGSLL